MSAHAFLVVFTAVLCMWNVFYSAHMLHFFKPNLALRPVIGLYFAVSLAQSQSKLTPS